MPKPAKILFAGGCHLSGFPVGAELSLVTVALRSIGHPAASDPAVLGHLTLRSSHLLVKACREQQAEILVLQVGHYETMPQFGKILRIGYKAGSGTTHSVPFSAEPDKEYVSSIGTRLIYVRRLVMARALAQVGQGNRVFNPARLAASLDEMLLSLKALPLRQIILLSPFSCPDPLTRECRSLAAPIFDNAANKHGCTFLDVYGLLESFPSGKAFLSNFADPCHLSRIGHQRVGLLVGNSLRLALERL